MRIAIMHGGDRPVHEQVEEIIQEEADGFDNVWFGQTFSADVLTIIALAGARTSRIGFGTSVIPTYPRHPFVMAQQAMTVQAATGNRLTLGIGPSHHMVIESMWGLSYEKPARHVREYLSVLLPLVREGKVSFNGEVYRTTAGIRIPGAEPLPVMVSALAPLMLKMAGELTDGTITWMTGAKTIESHIAPKLHAAASAAGRPQPRIAVGLPIAVTDNVADSRARAGQYFQMYGTLPNYRRVLDKEGVAGPADVVITGNEAACEQQLRAIASAGATDFFGAIYPVGDDAGGSMARTRALLQSLIGKL